MIIPLIPGRAIEGFGKNMNNILPIVSQSYYVFSRRAMDFSLNQYKANRQEFNEA